MQKLALLLCTIFLTTTSHATGYQEIRGIVKDAAFGHPLPGASLTMMDGQGGIVTDEKGKFTINAASYPEGLRLIVSYAGYQADTVHLAPAAKRYTVLLKPESGRLKEVVVRGVGATGLVKESPIAITKVSAQKIDQTLQSNIIDVLVKNVPGLNAVKTGPNISKPFIRGLGYNRVLTLYDGIRQEGQQWGDEHGIEIDPYGIEKAEVIKGPVSLMYGSDALAGVVRMQPFVPRDQDGQIHGRITSEYQQNNGLIGNGLRLYSSYQNWYWLVGGSYRLAKNYQNSVDGRVYNTNFKEGSAAVSLGHTTHAGHSTLNFTLFNDVQGIPDGSRDSLTRKFTRQVYEGEQDDITARPVVSAAELNSYRLSPLHQHIQHYRIYSHHHYKLGRGDWEGTLAWQQNIRQEYSHPTQPDQPGMNVQLNTLNYGLKYQLPVIQNTHLTIGSNGMHQDNKNKEATDFPIPDYQLLDLGAYLFAHWKYNRWTLSSGVRYDHRNVHGDAFYTVTDPSTGFDSHAKAQDPDASQAFAAFNKNFSGVSLSLGGTYALTGHISLKANMARGYRAPNITELASNGLDPGAHIIYIGNMASQPEFSFEQDLGMELSYKNFSGTLSLFHNAISHYIYLTQLADDSGPVLDPQGNKTFQYQQASARLYGLELSTSFHPVAWKGFTWNNNLALTYGINTHPAFKDKGIQGRYLPYIPPATWLSTVSQVIALKGPRFTSINFMAEMDYNAAQNKYLGLFDTETATPGYMLIHMAAGTSIQYRKNHPLQLQLAVNNIFNTVYQSNMSRLKYFENYSTAPNGRYGIYGIGRNICIKLLFSI